MNRILSLLLCLFFITPCVWAASAQKHLYQAAEHGDLTSLRKALKDGADVDQQDSDGWTALLFAATEGQEQTVRLLLSTGANPNIAGKKGETPLLGAVMSSKAALVKALLDAGADPQARLNSGQSALDLARSSSAQEIISFLQKVGSVSTSIDIPSIDKEVTKSSAYDEALEHLNTLFQQSRYEFLPGGHREHHLAVIENCVIKLQEKEWLDMYGSNENKDANVTLRQYILPLQHLQLETKPPAESPIIETKLHYTAYFSTIGEKIANQEFNNQNIYLDEYTSAGFLSFGDIEKANQFLKYMVLAGKACGAKSA